jgi:hypothetical protein
MAHFIEISFDQAILFFEEADKSGFRWRMGDFATSKWLQEKNISFDEVVTFSKNLPDSKIVVIGEGPYEGFYIYSQKQKTCFKFEQKLAQV